VSEGWKDLQDRAWEQLAVQRGRLEPHLAATEAKVKELRAEAAAGCGFVSLAGKVRQNLADWDCLIDVFCKGVRTIGTASKTCWILFLFI
jgi:hypothetical protein